MEYPEEVFPTYEYTYTVEGLLFDQGAVAIRYLPTNTNLPAVVLNLPLWPSMDINNLAAWVARFAPNEKWYAQEMILNHGNTILGNT